MSEVNCRDAGPGRGLCIECATGNYERCLYVAKNKNEALRSFEIIWSVILKEYPYWAVANTMHADNVRLALRRAADATGSTPAETTDSQGPAC